MTVDLNRTRRRSENSRTLVAANGVEVDKILISISIRVGGKCGRHDPRMDGCDGASVRAVGKI